MNVETKILFVEQLARLTTVENFFAGAEQFTDDAGALNDRGRTAAVQLGERLISMATGHQTALMPPAEMSDALHQLHGSTRADLEQSWDDLVAFGREVRTKLAADPTFVPMSLVRDSQTTLRGFFAEMALAALAVSERGQN